MFAIERENNLENITRIQALWQTHESSRAEALLQCRRVKEAFFTNPELKERTFGGVWSPDNVSPSVSLRLRFTPSEVRQVLDRGIAALGGMSWPQAYEEF